MALQNHEDLSLLKKTKKPKFGNQKTVLDGITFNSKAEAARYVQLLKMQEAGLIRGLKIKPRYNLDCGIRFYPDFEYEVLNSVEEIGDITTEDVKAIWASGQKGTTTADFKIKAKLFKKLTGREVLIVLMNPEMADTIVKAYRGAK